MEKKILSIFAIVVAVALIGMISSDDITGHFSKNKIKFQRAMHPRAFKQQTIIPNQIETTLKQNLEQQIKDLESQQKVVRNERQNVKMQNQMQRQQQQMQQISQIMKVQHETQRAVIRNMGE